MEPIDSCTAAELAGRLSDRARADLLEWNPAGTPAKEFQTVLSQEIPLQRLLDPNILVRTTDDQPFNEYFLLRELGIF
jgi:hypothetical protein